MIRIDEGSPMPVFEQLRSQLANQIRLGALAAGDRLPTVRQLAADLGIAPGTVARAYSLIEADGLVVSRRGGGTRVSVQADNYPEVLDAALEYVEIAQARGLDLDSTILAVRAAWQTERQSD